MQRVVIVGVTGSGKSTLGREIAAEWDLPLIELDELYWQPGWQPRDPLEFRELIDRATSGERWVAAGNYSAVRDLIWPRADTWIWLDYGLWRSLTRLLRRTHARIVTGMPVCNGNHETLAQVLSTDSIIVWFFRSYWRIRRNCRAALAQPPHSELRMIRFRHPRETEAWLRRAPAPG
jgi:adenylate kinase family enzyme